MKKEMSLVNQQIRKYRRLSNLTQAAMAQRLNMNEKTYSWLEREGNPKSDILCKISEVLDISVNILLNGEESSEPKNNGQSEITKRISTHRIQVESFHAHDSGKIPQQFLQNPPQKKYPRKEEQLFDVIHSLPTGEKDLLISFFDSYCRSDEDSREDVQNAIKEFMDKLSASKS